MSFYSAKPDWSTAPSWAKFLAMDADGEWFWFENEPTVRYDLWGRPAAGMCLIANLVDVVEWTDTLETRPTSEQAPGA